MQIEVLFPQQDAIRQQRTEQSTTGVPSVRDETAPLNKNLFFSPCRRLLRPLLTSSLASRHLTMSVALPAPIKDLPGYDAPAFTLMPVGSTSQRPVQVLGFDDIGRLTPLCRVVSASCSSGQRFALGFLQIRSYPRHPCRSDNSSPCRSSRGLSPPSKCALPGAPLKACDHRSHAQNL